MRKVALVDNPASGQSSPRRKAIVRDTLAALHQAGIEADHYTIDGPGSGSQLARQAMDNGCDAILVAGGDGTVHEILQSLVGTDVALGVVAMGTANALAADLGLAGSPSKAIHRLLQAVPVKVPVGRISFRAEDGSENSRYFTVAAGVGADALLMARMDPVLKRRLGYLLYLIEAFRIWASHPFPLFQASFVNGSGIPRTEHASQLLAVRVRSFGGALGRLAPGASLHSHNLALVAFKTRSRLRYMRFLLAVLASRQTFSSEVELISADSVECRPAPGSRHPVYVEADGEVLGHLPVRIEVAAETLTLLVPPNAQP
ncbi:MAG TPA: diacylglycerol kinase family protein [Terracidiphilus sp.]|nr:diacylglycerol kinase family protein [Terracidiphilus sp.]